MPWTQPWTLGAGPDSGSPDTTPVSDGHLDLLPAGGGQVRHACALGEETERVDQALALAAGGHRVALICSGDPGVYAMAALIFERLEMGMPAHPNRHRSEVVVLPGVCAMHGAAALAGASLGHDFSQPSRLLIRTASNACFPQLVGGHRLLSGAAVTEADDGDPFRGSEDDPPPVALTR